MNIYLRSDRILYTNIYDERRGKDMHLNIRRWY